MITIIAGSRGLTWDKVEPAIFSCPWAHDITEVISGCANGVDKLGEMWASENEIPIRRFPALWDKEGRGAGFLRNKRMAEHAEALIAVWDGKSRGTKHMIDVATRARLKIYVVVV